MKSKYDFILDEATEDVYDEWKAYRNDHLDEGGRQVLREFVLNRAHSDGDGALFSTHYRDGVLINLSCFFYHIN